MDEQGISDQTNPIFSLSKLTKELGIVGVGQVLAVLGSFIGVRILTEYLPADEYGSISLAIFTTQFSVQLFSGPLTNAFTRYYSFALEDGKLKEFYKSFNSLLISSSLLNLALGIVVVLAIKAFYSDKLPTLLWLALLSTILAGASSIINGIQTGARNRINVSLHQILLVWGKLGLAILFIFLFKMNAQAVLIGYLAASFLIFLSEYFFLRKRPGYSTEFSLNFQAKWPKNIIDFSFPFVLWGGFTWLFMVSDRWALELYTSRAEVGLYAVVYQVGYVPMAIAAGIFSQFISPIIFQKAGNAQNEAQNNKAISMTTWIALASLGFTIVAFLIALLIHKPFFEIIVAKEYREASYLFPYLILAGGLFETGQFAALKFLAYNSPKRLLTPKIITSLAGFGLVFVSAKFLGIEGVIGAFIIFSIVYLIWILKLKQ